MSKVHRLLYSWRKIGIKKMKCKNLRMDFAPKTQYDRTIKGAWKSAESNPKKHEEPKKYEEKEKTNMKKISRRDFLKASAATSGGALLTACGSSGSSTASTATSTSSAESGPVLSVTGLTWQIHPVPMSRAWATCTAGRLLRPTLVST